MPQNLVPTHSDRKHPNLAAPEGTFLLDPASLTLPDGGGPVVALPIEGGGVRLKRLPPEVAAEFLSWTPGLVQPRLATDEELAEAGLAHLVSPLTPEVPTEPEAAPAAGQSPPLDAAPPAETAPEAPAIAPPAAPEVP